MDFIKNTLFNFATSYMEDLKTVAFRLQVVQLMRTTTSQERAYTLYRTGKSLYYKSRVIRIASLSPLQTPEINSTPPMTKYHF